MIAALSTPLQDTRASPEPSTRTLTSVATKSGIAIPPDPVTRASTRSARPAAVTLPEPRTSALNRSLFTPVAVTSPEPSRSADINEGWHRDVDHWSDTRAVGTNNGDSQACSAHVCTQTRYKVVVKSDSDLLVRSVLHPHGSGIGQRDCRERWHLTILGDGAPRSGARTSYHRIIIVSALAFLSDRWCSVFGETTSTAVHGGC